MKKFLVAVFAGIISLALWGNPYEDFLSSEKEAFAQAKEDKKIVFALFTGSDWCPACIKLANNVISKKEFIEGLEDKYVLLLVDMPRYRRLKEVTARQNAQLMEKFKVNSFPTIVLITPEGEELKKFNYIPNSSVKNFMIWFNNESNEAVENYWKKAAEKVEK